MIGIHLNLLPIRRDRAIVADPDTGRAPLPG